jgi:transcription factor SOX9 (SOX group E)
MKRERETRDQLNSAMHYHASPQSDDYDDAADEHSALTSQTLNPDGTPKRPMNAFMIFARRRRPQVSAENQSMRTGDISKILSTEWKAMLPVRLVSCPRI